jgi:hypothetical protein
VLDFVLSKFFIEAISFGSPDRTGINSISSIAAGLDICTDILGITKGKT